MPEGEEEKFMNFLLWLGAIGPVIVLFAAMSVFHIKTERAALLGLICAIAASLAVGQSELRIAVMDLEKGAFSALNILIVIWPAIFLYEMLEYADIFRSIRRVIQKQTQDELMLILLISWLFSSFLQGITGFGVPVAVCAPLLIAIGVAPVWSVIITLLGHAWANTYGTFALAWDALVTQSETAGIFQTKLLAGCFLWGINLAGALLTCWLYGRGRAVRHMLPFVFTVSVIHGGGQLCISLVNSTIAAFLPATAALAAAWLILLAGGYKNPWSLPSKLLERKGAEREALNRTKDERTSVPSGAAAVFPFVLLAAVSVLVLLVRPVHDILYPFVIELSFPDAEAGRGFYVEAADSYGSIHLLTHAGFVLLFTAAVTYLGYRSRGLLKKKQMGQILSATMKKIIPTSAGILFLVMMAQVLKGSGLMEIVARGVTDVSGNLYGAAVPFVGLLGAFVTSSNTSSNILLGSFQKTAAELISANEAAVLAAQTAGGAIGTVVGPSTILLGTTTAGCKGKEGNILRFMLPIVAVEALLTGIATMLLV